MKQHIKKHIISILSFAISSKAPFFIFLELIGGILLSFSSLFIFIHLAKDILEKEGKHIDTGILLAIYTIRTPLLTKIMYGISFLGSELFLIVATAMVIVFAWRRHKKESFLFAIILSMSALTNWLIKHFVQRPRPFLHSLYHESSYSFPSGHAMNSFVFYTCLAYFMFHFTKNKKLSVPIAVLSFLLILLIGFSRLYLGVHYPSDVIGGFLAGFWIFITTLLIERTLGFYKLFKERQKDS